MSEARVDRLADDVREISARLRTVEEAVIRIETLLQATLPHLATKAELADKPSRGYLWGVMAAMVGAYTAALAAVAILLTVLLPRVGPPPAAPPAKPAAFVLAGDQPPPYSCRLLYDEQKKCAFGSCDKQIVERLTKECLRDGGRP